MMSLKELFDKSKKEELYNFYIKIVKDAKSYKTVTRKDIYKELLKAYYDDPEIILNLCSVEEINILKNLVEEASINRDNGYIEFLLFENLKKNYLIIEDGKYYIPDDLINYVKMAINLYQEKEYSWSDMVDSVILGFSRIYNVLELEELISLLSKYNMKFDIKSLKAYVNGNLKFRDKLEIKKYRNQYYLVSLENLFYKDILAIRINGIVKVDYLLEEIISIGKYKINLFSEPILNFLNFLEMHLNKKYIVDVLNDIIIYAGFQINDVNALRSMADNIEELYMEMVKVIPYFPVWILTPKIDNKE